MPRLGLPLDDELYEMAFTFARETLRPAAKQIERLAAPHDHPLFREVLHEGFAFGAHRLGIPEAMGGLGLDPVSVYGVTELLAWGDAGFATTLTAQNGIAGLGGLFGADFVDSVVRPCATDETGAWLYASALTEPNLGADALDFTQTLPLQSTARAAAGGFRLQGHKRFITNAPLARVLSVIVRMVDAPTDVAVALIAAGTPGLSFGRYEDKVGMRCSVQAEVVLDDVFVPASHLRVLPPPWSAMQAASLAAGAVPTAALGVGIAQAALDDARAHAEIVRVDGRRLIDRGDVAAALGAMEVDVHAARALAVGAARTPSGGPGGALSVAAKVHASATARRVTQQALDVMGGTGAMEDTQIPKLVRDACLLPAMHGTDGLARVLLGRGAYAH